MSDAPHPYENVGPVPPSTHSSQPDHLIESAVDNVPTVAILEPIAPWWHTACVLLVLGLWAALSGSRRHSYDEGPHSLMYLSQIMLSWMLFGTVIAGITHRRAFFDGTIGTKFRAWRGDALRGAVIYAGIYGALIAAVMLFAIDALAYQTMHPAKPAISTTATKPTGTTASPMPPPPTANPDPFAAFKNSRFRLDPKAVLALAPRTPIELLLWLVISATAGFSEEHIFRGYLLTQARAYTRLWGLSPKLATVLSVIAVSLIFGSLHIYEGLGGALVITFLGAVYAVVVIKMRTLRAVIVAHFLQDCIAGCMLFFLHAFYSHALSS